MNRKLQGILLLLVALLAVYSLVNRQSAADGAMEYLIQAGWQEEEIEILEGGYSGGVFAAESYLQFCSSKRPEKGNVYVMVRRSLPFSSWSVVEYEENLPVEAVFRPSAEGMKAE